MHGRVGLPGSDLPVEGADHVQGQRVERLRPVQDGDAETLLLSELDLVGHQSDRAAIQDSTLGQVPLDAPLPAITPMWPPGTRNSCLSVLPNFSRSRADWQGGVMWSS